MYIKIMNMFDRPNYLKDTQYIYMYVHCTYIHYTCTSKYIGIGSIIYFCAK